jgi:hypothetical protein
MKNFLTTILPKKGVFFIAAKVGGSFVHHPCRTVDEMVQLAFRIHALVRDAYFACASFFEAKNVGWVDPKKNAERVS